ncbi:MAG: hypothetical protein Q7Q73_14550 [Verrucomicrobiota bacterium JB024]|nr:hypothetical protein [Verrucomicrobiota bacterium JB024]
MTGVIARPPLLVFALSFALILPGCKPPASQPDTDTFVPSASKSASPGKPAAPNADASSPAADASPERMRMLAYAVGEGGGSFSLDGKREVSGELPVALVVWIEGTQGTPHVTISGMVKGVRMMPGAVVQAQPKEMEWSYGMMLPMSVVEDPYADEEGLEYPLLGTSDIPVHVRRIDDAGGDVHLDLAAADPDLSVWSRDVFWQAGGEVRIVDEVAAHLGKRFRFSFFGTAMSPGAVTRVEEKQQTIVETSYFTFIIQADSPVEVSAFKPAFVESYPPNPEQNARDMNTAHLSVECVEPQARLKLVTRIIPKDREVSQY